MKTILVAVIGGLLCAGAAQIGLAAPTSTAPPEAAANPSGEVGVTNASATPLSYDEYLPKLKEFYARGKTLYAESRSDKLSDSDVDSRYKEFVAWANEAGAWMNSNMSPATVAKFTTWQAATGTPHKLSGSHSDAENSKFGTLNIVLPQFLANLRTLMKRGAINP
jgi:hypothetical protein